MRFMSLKWVYDCEYTLLESYISSILSSRSASDSKSDKLKSFEITSTKDAIETNNTEIGSIV